MDTTTTDDDRAHLETERQLGVARLAAVVIGVLQLALQGASGPTWTGWLAWTGAGLLLAAGGLGLARAARPGRISARLADAAARAETVGLASLLPVAPDEHTAFVVLVLVLIAVFAGLRDGRRGAIRALVVGAAAEAVRVAVAATVAHVHPEETFTALVLAATVGLVVGHVADLSRQRADHARAEASRARAHAGYLDLQHRVLLAGVGGRVDEALQSMVDELQGFLAPATVTVVLRDGGELTVPATTDPDGLARRHAVLTPGSALTRALTRGEAAARTDDGHVTSWSAPIGHHDRVVGALCVDAARGVLDSQRLEVAARLATQMTLVIDAARALERETDLAERYRDLDRMKTDFVAVTSHELRTPLTAISGSLATLDERWDDLTPELRDTLFGVVRRQSARLERLTDDLRTVSRMDSGALRVEPRPTGLAAVASAVAAGAPSREDVRVEGEDVTVTADPDRLEQILSNLVNNGLAHGAPPVVITWNAQPHHVVVSVTDCGSGIPPEHRDRVFERFVHIAPSEAHGQGSGLGLAIARELAEAMGGDLTLDPSTRGGARFLLRLPRDDTSARTTGTVGTSTTAP